MGYYVSTIDGELRIRAENREKALMVLRELNSSKNDHMESGGSWMGGNRERSWFSWMPADWSELSLVELLSNMGFECFEEDNGDLVFCDYDSKSGQEDVMIGAIAEFVEGELEWIGEDNYQFKWVFEDGVMKVFEGCVVYEEV